MTETERQNICFAEFELDAAHRTLRRAGEVLPLNARTFDLLLFLVENNGRLVSKNEILNAVWEGQFVEEANLSVQISALRKALGEKREAPRFLITVPGKGYKFVAETDDSENEIVIEKHRVAQLVIEREESAARRDTEPRGGAKIYLRYLAAAAVLTACGLTWWILKAAFRTTPFQKVTLTRLTNLGKVSAAAIAPDGKYFAYVQSEPEGNSLWLQQVGTASRVRLLAATKAEFWHLAFSPDGAFIYYILFSGDKTDPELFRLPSLGGIAEKLPRVIAHAISFAPDGKRFVFVQSDSENSRNYLVIADADGMNQKALAVKAHPNTFIFDGDFAKWSPDGERVAVLVNHLEAEKNYASVSMIETASGAETEFDTGDLQEIGSLEWLRDGSGLLLTGSPQTSAQQRIWLVPYPKGEARSLTNDLGYYGSLGATADGKSVVALETNTTNGIFVGAADGAGEFREIVSETGNLNPLAFTPGGKIVFRSDADGVSNLWSIDANGANRRQLTTAADVDHRGMCVTADGKYLVFTSWRAGKSNLWRIDAESGANLTRLTNGEADAYPTCAPDSQTVVYQRGILAQPRLWKVSIAGGEPSPLTDARAKWASFAPDGTRLSYLKMADGNWRVGFLAADGQTAADDLSIPANFKEATVCWSADGRDLFYIAAEGSTGNVWRLPLDGSPPRAVTNFKSHALSDFALSSDRRLIAAVRKLSITDVVLLSEQK